MDATGSFESASETQVRLSIDALKALQPQIQDLQNIVSDYITTVQNAILKRREDYQTKLSQLKSMRNQLDLEIESNKICREKILEKLSKEMQSRDQSSLKYEEMKIRKESLEKEKESFTNQLDEIETQISSKIREINEQRDSVKNQTTLVNDKLYQFEQLLGLRIENPAFHSSRDSGDDDNDDDDDSSSNSETIRFIFKNVDPNDFKRTVSFTFDPLTTSITASNPELPPEIMSQGAKILIESKEIVYMWKFMRSALQAKLLES